MDTKNTSTIPLCVTNGGKPRRSKSKNRFQSLWDEAQRVKLLSQEMEESLDQVVLRIKNEVGPLEKELAIAMRSQIDKLIVFAGRKSLAQWQQVMLDEWIDSTLEFIEPFGLVDEALKNNLAGLQAKLCGINIDDESELSVVEQLVAGIEEQQGAVESIEDDLFADVDIHLKDFIDQLNENHAHSHFEDEYKSGSEQNHLGDESIPSNSINTKQPQTVFKTLFHRVARALHPDKESDPEKIKIKQVLMSQLLEARQQHDLLRIVELHQEHVEKEVIFADQELKELERVLIQFIDNEFLRMNEISTKSYLHEIAYREFYSPNPTRVDRSIAKKIKQLKALKKESQTFTEKVTSLKKLKPYLENRFDQMNSYF